MISDNDPILSRYISVPKELSQLNCNAFIAGIVEACLDGYQFVSLFSFFFFSFFWNVLNINNHIYVNLLSFIAC